MRSLWRLAQSSILAAAMLTACAPAPLELPSGAGDPFPEFRQALDEATDACRGVRTWIAEIGIAGRAGGMKLRGRALVGLERPDGVRLEGLAPFGQPLFILVAGGGQATLLLPRDRRVLRHESAAAIIEALTGVAIGPDELRQVVAGCVAAGEPSGGRAYANGWYAVDLGPATLFLRRSGARWRVEAGVRPGLTIEYRAFEGTRPSRVRLRADSADLTLTISQVDINTALPERAFSVDVPDEAVPLTLEELREAGPLGAKR